MKEKMYYIVGDTHNGKFYEQFDSYNEAMAYIKGEYTFEKAHEDEPYNTFIDGYYGIYRISEDDAERHRGDRVAAHPHQISEDAEEEHQEDVEEAVVAGEGADHAEQRDDGHQDVLRDRDDL